MLAIKHPAIEEVFVGRPGRLWFLGDHLGCCKQHLVLNQRAYLRRHQFNDIEMVTFRKIESSRPHHRRDVRMQEFGVYPERACAMNTNLDRVRASGMSIQCGGSGSNTRDIEPTLLGKKVFKGGYNQFRQVQLLRGR